MLKNVKFCKRHTKVDGVKAKVVILDFNSYSQESGT
jgi:hypothetical protein